MLIGILVTCRTCKGTYIPLFLMNAKCIIIIVEYPPPVIIVGYSPPVIEKTSVQVACIIISPKITN